MRTWAFGAAVALALGGSFLAVPHAQQNQPIYPVYDGFLKNPDGSYTLSFAYFSHNADVVTVPPGAEQRLRADARRSDAADDVQARPLAVSVRDGGRARLRRQDALDARRYAGTTTGTSERMLQSNWNLVEGASELGKIDFAKVPRGVCLNRAPQVRVLGITPRRGQPPTLTVTVGEELHIFGSVNDEGLPRGKDLVVGWKMLSGPGTVSFSNATAARTKATFPMAGTYELELTATDSELSGRTRINVNVSGGRD